jgi:hypothetical protein
LGGIIPILNPKLIGSKSKFGNNYHSKINYLPKLNTLKNLTCVKHECIFPYNLESFLFSKIHFLNKDKSTDPNVTRITNLNYYTKEEILDIYKSKGMEKKVSKYQADQTEVVYDFSFGPLFNPRQMMCSQKIYYDKENNSIILIAKPFLKEGMEFSKATKIEMLIPGETKPKLVKAYPIFDWIFNLYQEIDDHKTLFTQVHLMDPGGWFNSDLLTKLVTKRRGDTYRESMINAIENLPKNLDMDDLREKYSSSEDICVFDRMILNLDYKRNVSF